MTPYEHSVLSVRDFGGEPEYYLKIHEFLDSTKFQLTDFRHRAILHNPFGIGLCEQLFGPITQNNISVREVARRHIEQDCGGIVPTTQQWLDALCSATHGIQYNKPLKKDLEYLKTHLYEIDS